MKSKNLYGINKLILVLIMFFYIYEINLSYLGVPTFVTSRRIVIFMIIFFSIFKNMRIPINTYNKDLRRIINLSIFLAIYIFIISLVIGFGTGDHILFSLIRFLLFSLLPIFAFVDIFKSKDNLLNIIIIVSLIQSIIIVICLLLPDFAFTVDKVFGQEGYALLRSRGYNTGLGAATSKGSLQLSLGIIALGYKMISQNRKILLYTILFMFITFASTTLSRTGLLLSFLVIVSIFIKLSKRNWVSFIKMLFIMTILLIVAIIVVNRFDLLEDLQKIFKRLMILFENGPYKEYFEIYLFDPRTSIPSIDFRTIVGTGITSGLSGNNVFVNVDGGYLRLYVALGLPLSIIFYSVIFYSLFLVARKSKYSIDKYVLLQLIIILFLGEIKEMYIFTGYLITVFFTYYFLSERIGKADEHIVLY